MRETAVDVGRAVAVVARGAAAALVTRHLHMEGW